MQWMGVGFDHAALPQTSKGAPEHVAAALLCLCSPRRCCCIWHGVQMHGLRQATGLRQRAMLSGVLLVMVHVSAASLALYSAHSISISLGFLLV